MVDYEKILIGDILTDHTPSGFTWRLSEVPVEMFRQQDSGQMEIMSQVRSGTEGMIMRYPYIDVVWDMSNPCIDEARQVLMKARETQVAIPVQFDIIMSRNITKLAPVGTNFRYFKTPTWPILPFDHTSGPYNWNFHLYVNGEVVDSTRFSVDADNGFFIFRNDEVGESDTVSARYQWRANCVVQTVVDSRISSIDRDMYEVQARLVPVIETVNEVSSIREISHEF